MSFDRIADDFTVLDDWDDRYRYIIDLGRKMPPFPEELRTEGVRVRGCASQVWIVSSSGPAETGAPTIAFMGDSDALIVRGLIAVLLELYNGRSPQEILSIDARSKLATLGLDTHLSQQRSNGLFAMIERMRADASASLARQG